MEIVENEAIIAVREKTFDIFHKRHLNDVVTSLKRLLVLKGAKKTCGTL
jgi:hypothetical protein